MEKNNPRLPFEFYAVLGARLASVFGTFLSMIALNVFILELTGSPAWVGAAMAVKVLSGIATAPFVGRAVDRYDRKTLMILSDVVLAASMLSLVFVPAQWSRDWIIAVMVLQGVFSSLFEVALGAATPCILNSQDTLKANSWLMGGRNLMVAISGLCAAGARYLFEGYDAIFVIDAATYLFSALVLARLSIRTGDAAPRKTAEKASFMQMMRQDLDAVRSLPNARMMTLFLGILFLDAFASASHNVGWPIFSTALLPSNPMLYYGLILFFWAMGNVAGIYLLNRLPALEKLSPETLYMGFTALMSAGMIMIFQTESAAVITASAFIAGAGDGTYQTYYTTYLQQTPDSVRGRIFALSGVILRTGFGLGFMAVPFAMHSLPVKTTVLVFHGLVLTAVAVCLLYFKKQGACAPRAS